MQARITKTLGKQPHSTLRPESPYRAPKAQEPISGDIQRRLYPRLLGYNMAAGLQLGVFRCDIQLLKMQMSHGSNLEGITFPEV